MQQQLPLYQCHKQVRAAKIVDIAKMDYNLGATLKLALPGNPTETVTVNVDSHWLGRNPHLNLGGYFVHYCQNADNYTAYSPAAPFENGYTLAADPAKEGSDKTVAYLDPKSLIEYLESALSKAKSGELLEATIIGKQKDGNVYLCSSGSFNAHEMAGKCLDAAILRLGYKLR